jgi:hypothetical protein
MLALVLEYRPSAILANTETIIRAIVNLANWSIIRRTWYMI